MGEKGINVSNESTPLLDTYTSFDDKYTEEKQSSLLDEDNKDPYAPSLIRTLICNFGGSFALTFTYRLIHDVIKFFNPLLLKWVWFQFVFTFI